MYKRNHSNIEFEEIKFLRKHSRDKFFEKKERKKEIKSTRTSLDNKGTRKIDVLQFSTDN